MHWPLSQTPDTHWWFAVQGVVPKLGMSATQTLALQKNP
jgi:hypothetical protein